MSCVEDQEIPIQLQQHMALLKISVLTVVLLGGFYKIPP